MPGADKSKVPLSIVVTIMVGVVGLLGTIGAWSYQNLAGHKDIEIVDTRVTKTVDAFKEGDKVLRADMATTEARVNATIDRERQAQAVINAQNLQVLTEIRGDVKMILMRMPARAYRENAAFMKVGDVGR